MASTQKPTIVVVPGSFSIPPFYDIFVSQLSAHNYNVQVVSLPSVGGKTATNMTDDANAIQAMTTKIADEGKDIVLVMHSYGGIPGTESAHGLAKKDREATGKKGGVVALLYVTALLVQPGKSLGSTLAEGPGVPDYVKVDVCIAFASVVHGISLPSEFAFSVNLLTLHFSQDDFMTLEPQGNAKVTFSDLPMDEALAWAAKMPHHSAITFGDELNYPTYKDIPSSYLFTMGDKVIPPELQRSMVDAANELRGSPITEYDIPSGHVPFINVPGAVVDVVRKVAGEKF
jgi:pimeloyl-ACP methyl ester carboxylesterase